MIRKVLRRKVEYHTLREEKSGRESQNVNAAA
jgi:hypothetical protein